MMMSRFGKVSVLRTLDGLQDGPAPCGCGFAEVGHHLESLEPRVLLAADGLAAIDPTVTVEAAAMVAAASPMSAESSTANMRGGPGGGNGGGNGGGGSGGGDAGPDRAVWVWGEEVNAMVEDTTIRDGVLSFLADESVTTVYLYAGPFFGASPYPIVETPDLYAGLVSDLHAQGVSVYGLLDSIVVDADAPIVDQFDAVLDYNTGRPDSEQLDGVNFDIEPWANPALNWDANREALSQQYLDLADTFAAMRDLKDPTMTLGPAMPFWFDTFSIAHNGQTVPMNQHTQSAYDYVTVMNFRDAAEGADGLIAHAQAEIDFGNAISKPVVIGVETNDVADANNPEKVTFFEEGDRVMERELKETARAFRDDASFAGFAIQDLVGYVALTGANVPLSSQAVSDALASASLSLVDAGDDSSDDDAGFSPADALSGAQLQEILEGT